MRNPCKDCIYYHKENRTCQSKKCATGGSGKVSWVDRLFCSPCKKNGGADHEADVDAVIVTRCKDCKHRGGVQIPCNGINIDYCKVWDGTVQDLESTFCSYGERKDGGAE